MPAAILGGTGLYSIPGLNLSERTVTTKYGEAKLFVGRGADSDLVFLTRHGADHSIPPHKINYRANIKALEMLGVKRIIANYAVGGIHPEITPMGVATVGDFLDFTSGRESTFIDGTHDSDGVDHVEMSQPYCPTMSKKLVELGPSFGLNLFENAVYAAANGPRFETPAEIRMMKMLGGDIVGMTGVPEVVLARELGMCFAAVVLSINWAAGITPNIEIVEDKTELATVRQNVLKLCVAALRATKDEDCVPAVMI